MSQQVCTFILLFHKRLNIWCRQFEICDSVCLHAPNSGENFWRIVPYHEIMMPSLSIASRIMELITYVFRNP